MGSVALRRHHPQLRLWNAVQPFVFSQHFPSARSRAVCALGGRGCTW